MLGVEGTALEAERGSEELAAEAASLELRRNRMDAVDLILEVGVADDDPLEAEGVALAVELRSGLLRDALEQLFDLALRLAELPGREWLEDHRAPAPRLERALGVERDRPRPAVGEPLARRLPVLLSAR